jgi:hypothetical protein
MPGTGPSFGTPKDASRPGLLGSLARRRIFAYCTAAGLPLVDGHCLRKSDIVLSSIVSYNTGKDTYDSEMFSISEKRLSWKTIRLAAELKQSNKCSDYDSTVAQLANYIRDIVGSQQTRMWVYGFMFCGDEFRAWLFDRAGGLGTRLVNMHKEPSIIIKAIIGFACMGSSQLGFDPTIRWKPQGGEPNVVYDVTLFHTLLNPPVPYIKVETNYFTECLEIDVRPFGTPHRDSQPRNCCFCWSIIESGSCR